MDYDNGFNHMFQISGLAEIQIFEKSYTLSHNARKTNNKIHKEISY